MTLDLITEAAVERGFVSAPQKGPLLALANALKEAGYRFTTCTPKTHAIVNARAARAGQWAQSPAEIYGWSRPYLASPENARWHALNLQAGIAVAHQTGWTSAVRMSTLFDHYYFHSAYPTSDANAVFFGPDTYRFVHALRARLTGLKQVRRALDIGCGTGAAAISIAQAFPLAEVIAADVNDAALALTEVNCLLAGAANVAACRSHLYADITQNFDLIVANPPYLNDKEKRRYRHGGGEFGGALSIAIAAGAIDRLNDGGTLLLYTGAAIVNGEDTLLNALQPLLSRPDLDWSYEELDPDVFGEELEADEYALVERIAVVWLEIRKSGNPA